MNSRDTVLSRIRNALSDRPNVELPPPPEIWPETGPDADAMAKRFADEIAVVEGEFFRCGSPEEAQKQLQAIMKDVGCETIAAVDRPLARELTSALNAEALAWAPTDTDMPDGDPDGWDPPAMGQIELGLLSADYLLADTGSCVVECLNPQERMMCYMPPNCVVVAKGENFREHMPAAWKEIAQRTAQPDRRGEFVVITGPSRTADIEKILILGVHGPKRLFVLLVE
ncbi:MAG: LUD domain-containing protein [Planctomycetota bacterium]|nr:LUD domain-containing protein [Planctomycetota bacterium]